MSVEITRLEQTERGTLGVILVDGRVVCYSLELPWKENKPNVSCIPTGQYDLLLEWSPAFGKDLYELYGVDGRSEIKIHIGNSLGEMKGCIILGTDVGYNADGERYLYNSRKAFDKFMAAMDDRDGDNILVRGV